MKYEIMSVLCELTNVQQFSKNLNSGKNKSNIKLRFSDELGVPNHENIFWIDKKRSIVGLFQNFTSHQTQPAIHLVRA